MWKRMPVFVLVAGVLLLGGAQQTWSQPRISVHTTFADLDDYGEWYKLPKIGWVWAPYSTDDWRPFMYGHWAWTPDGWTWVSYEPFGWITCHYGYWYYDDDYGWLWVPGYEWSPARVRWVVTDYEVAWAPLPPPGRSIPPAFAPRAHVYWVVVPARHFTAHEVYRHRQVQTSTRPVKRRVLRKSAPDVKMVRRVTNTRIAPVEVRKSQTVAGERKLIKLHVPHKQPKQSAPVGVKYQGHRRRPPGVEVHSKSKAPHHKEPAAVHKKGPHHKQPAAVHKNAPPQKGTAARTRREAPVETQQAQPGAQKRKQHHDPRTEALLKEKQDKEASEKSEEEKEMEEHRREKEKAKARKY